IIILMELSRPINTSHEGEGASVIGSSNLEATNDEEDILGDETLLSVSIRGERENDSYENQRNQQQQLEEMSQEESAIDEPFFGQIFSNAEKAKDFYNIYAFKTGFSIRKQSHYKAKKLEGMVTTLVYTCSKEGQSKRQTNEMGNNVASSQTNRTPQKEFPFRRCGCKAHLRLKMVEGGKWMVMSFNKEHNHDLIVSPSKARFFRSHRSITNEQKEMINMLSEQNISTSQIMSFLAAREGGMKNIHFTRKDLSNAISEWASMLEKYDLLDNSHLCFLWNCRYQWTPAYFRSTFFANMSTSQCSEGMNALSKIFLDSHTSAYKFVIQFEKIVSSRYEKEDEEEFKMKDGEAT
ncbi:Protein FAR1-RELATED SEQUENCE 5, partial [Ananas comosus]